MKQMWMAIVMVVLGGSLLGSKAWSASAGGAQAVDLAWKQAIEAGDLEGVVACYGQDATLWLPGDPVARGREAIRGVYQGLLAANRVSDVRYANTRYLADGKIQAGAGDFSLVLTPKDGGASSVLRGRFSTVVEQEKGRWVYVVDHASAGPAQ